MNRFIAIKNGSNVTVNLNGNTRIFNYPDEEEMQNFMFLCQRAKMGDSTALQEFTNMFDPSYRQPALQHLEKDQQGRYYLKGYNIPMPVELVEKIREYMDLNYPIEALLNFWKLLMLNPDEHVRTDLFKFADRFSFPITDKGYFIAYKSVAWAGVKHKKRAIRVAQRYVYEKANGRDPQKLFLVKFEDDYIIISQEEYAELLEEDKQMWMEENNTESRLVEKYPELIQALAATDADQYDGVVERLAYERGISAGTEQEWKDQCEIELLGDLETAFQQINVMFEMDEPAFTDFHTMKSTIKIGVPMAMDREDCDNDPNRTCSSGLHVGAPGYVRNFGHGDAYILACLVSPADVVAVPYDYDFEKMRTCRYYPYAVCELDDNGHIKEIETKYFENDYAELEMEEIDRLLQENSAIAKERELTEEEVQQNNILTNRLIDLRG